MSENFSRTSRHSPCSMDTDNLLKAGSPIGALPPHDSGFDEPEQLDEEVMDSGLYVPQESSQFRGQDVEPDKVMTNDFTTTGTRLDSGIDSGLVDLSLEKRVQSMRIEDRIIEEPSPPAPTVPITHSNNNSRRRLPNIASAKTSRMVESVSRSSSSNVVQALSHRSESPVVVSSNYNSLPQTRSSYTEQYNSAPIHQYQYQSVYDVQSHSAPMIDVRAMLQQNLQFFIPDKEGDTGLHLAVIHSQSDLLDRLLYLMSKEPGLQTVIDDQNSLYQTPLHLAVHTQQTDMIRKLLLSGASLNVPDHKGNTALHIAARFTSTKSLEELALYVPLQTLLEVARIRNNNGQTCVHVAAQYGNTDVLRKLKSLGVDIDMQDLKSGKTALHVSVENSSLRDVQFLLETCHANVNATTFTGCTPLHIAAGRGDISTAAFLLSQGANPDLQTDEGDTALEIAGSDEVMSLLTKAAALKWMY